ncbi:hypothetical protein OHA72_46080 [Dactylosporangium sp. NBC_01737]|uniref:hypothetical protein n=1 Tax=Dactylosporangium sp. NBC_01737 TaxID=2975959 RepID=UPI002E132440|nr:hypothetical protein OHA72_46080 [Dactylosporangium sp. NBC_01737]
MADLASRRQAAFHRRRAAYLTNAWPYAHGTDHTTISADWLGGTVRSEGSWHTPDVLGDQSWPMSVCWCATPSAMSLPQRSDRWLNLAGFLLALCCFALPFSGWSTDPCTTAKLTYLGTQRGGRWRHRRGHWQLMFAIRPGCRSDLHASRSWAAAACQGL